jgi:hypothetical protein
LAVADEDDLIDLWIPLEKLSGASRPTSFRSACAATVEDAGFDL